MRTPGAVLSASCLLFVAGANAAFDYHSIRGRKAAVTDDIIEGEALPMKRGSRVQGMRNFGPQWSGDAHLLWDGKIGESMESRFHVPHDGRYALSLVMTLAPDYGMFSVSLNGKVVKEGVDLYSAKVKLSPVVDLGEVRLKAGEQTLLCTLTGSNEKAKHFRGDRFLLGLDYIKAVPLDPSPTQQEKSPKLPERTAFPTIDHTFEEVRTVLEKYCYDCHGDGGKPKGNVDLTKLTSRDELLENAKLANKLADVLQYREMPPKGKDRPTEGESRMLVSFSNRVVYEALEKDRTLPPIVIRRMNRYEYNNAVRDLLQLKGDIYPLPEKVIRPYKPYFDPASGRLPNSIHVGNRALGKNQIEQHLLTGVSPFAIDLQAEHGFNNRGDELSISPILMESFLKLARSVVESREFDGYSALTGSFFKPPAGSQEDEWSAIARERLAPILERAFRQPVEATTASLYLGLFDREVKAGMDFQQAMKSTIAAILSSPRFLYLLERKEGESKPLTPYELASRLSFFLWSSIPDEELLALARSGELAKPEVYGAQLERMLLHKASKALSENFARQWLRLDRLITAVPDFERFEPYYSRIGCEQWKLGLQTMIEPLLLFESIMVEDRSIMLLVDSNYSYRTGEMASWYKPGVPFGGKGNRNRFNTNHQVFTRQPVNSRREGGVITCSATLTMNASPLRTSPITRGAWVADVIFSRPPPPPPDVVPEIEADDAKIEASGLTLRQRLIEHQVNPSCVSCHQKIDPLGFALENYNAVGRWRDKYRSGLEIDASGELFGKAKFNDAVELKDAILANPEWFMRGFSEHLLSYALGRKLELADKPAVDQIVIEALDSGGQFSRIVKAVAKSYPFLRKANALDLK